MPTVIKIENLSKKYVLGHQKLERYATLRDAIAHNLTHFGQKLFHPRSPNKEKTNIEEFWALKDINFKIKQGEKVGIIGRNGAGKSTLLKILSRITEPTTGRITIKRRVASLLEVGTGFHPELTGRENIFLNGAILGMNRLEINKKFDEIVDFAEIERFLDTPVKRYSSGMYVRLAFAVAAHLESEILVVDEVLAVGDAQFQKKCLGKMGEIGKDGRTVLFVSHNMGAVNGLCSRVLVLEHGRIACIGDCASTIRYYLTNTTDNKNNYGETIYPLKNNNTNGFDLHALRTLDKNGTIRSDFVNSESIIIEFEFSLLKPIPYLKIGFRILDRSGSIIFVSFHNDIKEILNYDSEHSHRYRLRALIPKNLLNENLYNIKPLIVIHRQKWIINDIRGLSINVTFDVANKDYVASKRNGSVAPLLEWFAPLKNDKNFR